MPSRWVTEFSVSRLFLTTAIVATLVAATVAPAAAEKRPAVSVASDKVRVLAADPELEIAIPAGTLSEALASLGRQARMQISYDPDLVQGLTSGGLSGRFTANQALRRLLSGTGIGWRSEGGRTVVLEKGAGEGALALDPITVQGAGASRAVLGNPPPEYAGGQVASGSQLGLLGNRSVFDTPFNTTNYTAGLIADQQATSLADVVATNPAVRAPTPSDGQYDNFTIRGFGVSAAAFTMDGLPGILPGQRVAPEFAERVEVFNGPSGLLNNVSPFGPVGGTINIVPKRAGDTPILDVTGSYLSDLQFGAHVDAGRRFGPKNEFGIRFNGVFRDGDTAIDDQSERLGLAFLSADYKGDRLRASLDFGYQEQRVDAPYLSMVVASGVTVPEPPKSGSNPFQAWSFNDARDFFGAVRGEYDITDHITAYAAVGYKDDLSILLSSYQEIEDTAGNTTVYPYFEPYFTRNLAAETGLRSTFQTASIDHALNVGVTTHYVRIGYADTFFSDFSSNIYNRVDGPEPNTSGLSEDPNLAAKYLLTSVAVADTVSFGGDRIQITAGMRAQKIKVDNFDVSTGAKTASYNEGALTPAVSFVVRPFDMVSVYGNYIEGLSQGPVAPSGTSNAGEIFPPTISRQLEGGVKVDFGRFATTASIFQITQPSGLTDASTNTFVVDGEQRNRGLELNVFGEAYPGVRLLGGVAFTEGELTSTSGGTNDGNTAPGVSAVQVNLAGEWDVPFLRGLTLMARGVYTSSQYLDAGNTQKIPDWTRFDLGARYTLDTMGVPVVLRATVENVANENYWASAAGGTLSLGTPRRVLLSATARF